VRFPGAAVPARWPRPGRWPRAGWTALASGGLAGPLLFTAAWLVGSLRQTGHSAAQVQLSGLAAMDARDPQIMMAGFIGLGLCSVAFGAALRRVPAAGSAGPRLVQAAGVAAVAAGLFRRDHLLLTGPGWAGESWHNQVHDLVSGVAYAAMIAAPLVLAWRLRRGAEWRLRRGADWRLLSPVLATLALASAATLALFAAQAAGPATAAVQRAAVSFPLAAEMLLAAWLLARRPA